MATNTPNYNLVKPSYTEFADIQVLNGNADIIDSAMKGNADNLINHDAKMASKTAFGHVRIGDGINVSGGVITADKNFPFTVGSINIPSGSNLNDYTNPGVYYTTSSAVSMSLINGPGSYGGRSSIRLTVFIVGTNAVGQRLEYGNGLASTFNTRRSFYRVLNGDWSNWTITLDAFYGSGSPEGSVTAPIGSFYSDFGSTNGETTYIKESGTGNTGWKLIVTDQKSFNHYVAVTGTNTLTINSPGVVLEEGMHLTFKAVNNNTGNVSINFNSGGNKSVLLNNGNQLPANKLRAGGIYTVIYGGTNFQLANEGGEYGTAGAAQVLAGYTVGLESGVVNGTMVNNGAVNHSLAVNGDYTIPAGYHNGSGVVTQSLTTKTAATFTPSTTNQTIASGQYLSGTQTILGDSDLIASNIKSGVNIFGVVGNVQPKNYYSRSIVGNDTTVTVNWSFNYDFIVVRNQQGGNHIHWITQPDIYYGGGNFMPTGATKTNTSYTGFFYTNGGTYTIEVYG